MQAPLQRHRPVWMRRRIDDARAVRLRATMHA